MLQGQIVRPRQRPRLALVWDRSCHKTSLRPQQCRIFEA